VELTRVVAEGRQVVQSHRPGGFTIAGVRRSGSVLVLPTTTLPWPATTVAEVTLDGLAPLLGTEPAIEILVLGCGARFAMVATELRQGLRARGIALEAMDTRAACRTFNVLLAEDRRVAAALIAL
jgi:uncharacterized protein